MSLLSSLEGLAGHPEQGDAAGSHTAVAQALVQEADQHPGGLAGLLNQFSQNGMADHVNSWVSPGANQSVSPDQVQQGMGSGMLNSIAQRAGISPTVAKVALAAVLPLVVSHLSQQHGQVPSQGGLAGLAGSLFSRL